MTYWKKGEKAPVDSKGVETKPGDIIQSTSKNTPWNIFICYLEKYSSTIEVRDQNANNVCMCHNEYGVLKGVDGEDLINLGNFMDNLDLLTEEDCTYYFEIKKVHAEELRNLRNKVKGLEEKLK